MPKANLLISRELNYHAKMAPDMRDRELISVMTFAFARVGAVVAMRIEDYYPKGKRWCVRLH